MAQYITTLSFGARSIHLSHTGERVFSSPHYMTGGSIVGGVIFRGSHFCDARQPRQVLNGDELHRRMNTPHLTHWQAFVSRMNELAVAWSLPFRKGKKRYWNPLLG